MLFQHYNKNCDVTNIQQIIGQTKEKVSFNELGQTAERIGFRTRKTKLTYSQLTSLIRVPCILMINQTYYVVIPARSKWGKSSNDLHFTDPALGAITYPKDKFLESWANAVNDSGESAGLVLLLEPTFKLYAKQRNKNTRLTWTSLLLYFRFSFWQVVQVLGTLVIATLLQLLFPFLMQSLIDNGIGMRNLHFVTVILIAQLTLVFTRAVLDLIRGYLLLRISNIISISVLSDFWVKITALPMAYFTQHPTGDILQRLNDNKQIHKFLTGPALQTVYLLLNFFVFAIVLITYKANLFLIYAAGIAIYFLWVQSFLGVKRKVNNQIFHASIVENNATLQLTQGMQEIKMQNIEQSKRWEWERAQYDIFRFNFKSLIYNQAQQGGVTLIHHGTSAVLTFMVAKSVVGGELTLGAMLAIQYIIGQLSSPIESLLNFYQLAQDTKISMERINEIYQKEDEEDFSSQYVHCLPEHKKIILSHVSFAYPGVNNGQILNNIHLEIPEGKTTAIVGVSGSGKTTLIKLLLKFYQEYNGNIRIGDVDLKDVSPSFWRRQCGVVLQDSYIFNSNIAKNIAVQDGQLDYARLIDACRAVNILSFIECLPEGFNTKLGVGGISISNGQKQRILIARAIYKNPSYLFFDEATNSLDSSNEKIIVKNLFTFFRDRTVVVVAHRLSTVRDADKIIVLDKGTIIEEGNHYELCMLKGKYYELVSNQLELGN